MRKCLAPKCFPHVPHLLSRYVYELTIFSFFKLWNIEDNIKEIMVQEIGYPIPLDERNRRMDSLQ